MRRSEEKDDERDALISGKIDFYSDNGKQENEPIQTKTTSYPTAFPLNEQSINRTPSGLERLQLLWIRWMRVLFWLNLNPILTLGYEETLTNNDLEDLSYDDTSSALFKKFLIYDWSKSTTWCVVLRAFAKETFHVGLIVLPYVAVRLAQPLFIRAIIQQISYKGGSSFHVQNGILFSIGLFLCSIIQGIVYHQLFFRSTRVGMRIRHALSVSIYQHLLSISVSSFGTDYFCSNYQLGCQ